MSNNKYFLMSFISIFAILSSVHVVSAATWYPGDLHRHTGFSTVAGYDGVSSSECSLELEDPTGYTIEELKEQIDAAGIHFWLSLTDHSYCLDSTEWNTVESDASTYSDSNVLFLPSEEVSVEEDCAGYWDEGLCGGLDSTGHLGAHGISTFIESDGEEWCPEWPNSQDTINDININGFSIINHPEATHWDWESMSCTSSETGIEVWNGEWDSDSGTYDTNDENAVDVWKQELLDGKGVYAYGGSDSHDGVDTTVYNYAYLDSFNVANLETALSSGKSTVSNNGLIYLEVLGENQDTWTLQGAIYEVCNGDTIQINASYDINHDCERGYFDTQEINMM